MKVYNDLRYILAFGAFLLMSLLLFHAIDLDTTSRIKNAIEIPVATIASDYGDGSYRMKTLEDPEKITYKMYVTQKTLNSISEDKVYLSIGSLKVEAYEVYMNGQYLTTFGDYIDGHSDVGNQTHMVTLPMTNLEDQNLIELRTRSVISMGVQKKVLLMNEVDMLANQRWIIFDRLLTSLIVFGTFMFALLLIYLSYGMLRVKDRVFGDSYIWLSAAVIMLSIHNIELTGDFYYIVGYEAAEKLNHLLIFGAGYAMSTATKFWVGRRRRIIIGPILLTITLLFPIFMNSLIIYEKYLFFLIAVYVGINIYSLIEMYLKSEDLKTKQFAVNVGATIFLSATIRFSPTIIIKDLILDATSIGVVPLCMFWFLVSYSIIKEMSILRQREQKEAVLLKLQQEHVFKNMGEGFFRVNRRGEVENVLTSVCDIIFGKDIKGEKLNLLIGEGEEIEFIDELLQSYFNKKIAQSVCFELFPEEIKINDRYFKISYEPEKDGNEIVALVVVMSDITETKLYEITLSQERNKLKMVVSVMLNRDDMVDLINEFLEFTSEVTDELYQQTELMNKIHTFKGNFGMYNLIFIVSYLHELEDALINEKALDNNLGNALRNALYEDLEVITETTGSSFFEDEMYLTVNKHNLEKVYKTIKKYFYDKEASLILSIVEQIFYKSIGDVLMFYAKESVKLASKKGKIVNIATIVGDEVFVDINYYRDVFRSLVHVFNNCIEHGIEEEEERMMIGKSPYGELTCSIDDLGNFFEVMIADDGRGINLGEVHDKAISKGIISEEVADHMSEEDLMALIFEANFSTKSYADTVSGRGVGMAAVKAEVEKIGGRVRVSSIMDFGTTIKLLLPKNQAKFIKFFSLPIILDLFVESSKIYLKSNNIVDLPLSVAGVNKGVEALDVTVILPFKGPKVGAFYMSGNHDFVKGLSKAMLELEANDEIDDALYKEVSVEAMKETLNIIAGNAISLFDVDSTVADIGTPEEIDDTHEIYDYNMLTWSLKYEGTSFCLGIVNGYEGDVVNMDELMNS